MNWLVRLAISGAVLASAIPATAETHELKLTPGNVHWGYYDARIKPVLRIASGDTVRIETLTASGVARLIEAGASEAEIPSNLREVETLKQHDLSGIGFVAEQKRFYPKRELAATVIGVIAIPVLYYVIQTITEAIRRPERSSETNTSVTSP